MWWKGKGSHCCGRTGHGLSRAGLRERLSVMVASCGVGLGFSVDTGDGYLGVLVWSLRISQGIKFRDESLGSVVCSAVSSLGTGMLRGHRRCECVGLS